MSIELKIKQVSLALEAKYIKQQEIKLLERAKYCQMRAANADNSPTSRERFQLYALRHQRAQNRLQEHRKVIVACESRATNIARAYIKGKPLSWAESQYDPANPPDWDRVARMIQKYKNNGTYYRRYDKEEVAKLKEVLINEWAST